MTISEALEKAAASFDEHAADLLARAEAVLRARGATAEELHLELERLRRDIAETRRTTLEHVRAYAESGQWSIH